MFNNYVWRKIVVLSFLQTIHMHVSTKFYGRHNLLSFIVVLAFPCFVMSSIRTNDFGTFLGRLVLEPFFVQPFATLWNCCSIRKSKLETRLECAFPSRPSCRLPFSPSVYRRNKCIPQTKLRGKVYKATSNAYFNIGILAFGMHFCAW